MKLGVLTNLFGKMSLEEALTKFEALGIEAAEIGCGGYPGKAHCDPKVLLADPKALDEFKATLARHHIELSNLSVHGNPVHPDKKIAKGYHDDFVDAVLLAENSAWIPSSPSPAAPADLPRIRPRTGRPAPGRTIFSPSSIISGTRC